MYVYLLYYYIITDFNVKIILIFSLYKLQMVYKQLVYTCH